MGTQLRNQLESRFRAIFSEINASNNTPEAKAAAMAAAAADEIVSQLKVSIPAGSVIISATGGVPNPTPIECNVESR